MKINLAQMKFNLAEMKINVAQMKCNLAQMKFNLTLMKLIIYFLFAIFIFWHNFKKFSFLNSYNILVLRLREVKDFPSQSFSSDTLQGKSSE